MDAVGILATNLHDLGHTSTREKAIAIRQSFIMAAGQFLIHYADLSSEELGFDLAEAFDTRLASLRERLNIPEPSL
jgi:hypothetical protein